MYIVSDIASFEKKQFDLEEIPVGSYVEDVVLSNFFVIKAT